MSGSAWVMLLATWSIVIYFTSRFLVKILCGPRIRANDSGGASMNRRPTESKANHQ